MIGGPVPRHIDDRIRAAIGPFPVSILDIGTGVCPPLVIKYIPPKFATIYHRPGQKINISDTLGFTWGRATYVAPIAFPLSTAIFGRIGVVSRFDPNGWRTFDATVAENQQLYIQWLQTRPLYPDVVLTAHSAYILQMLRDLFRSRYDIDCVLFRPDQSNPRYTKTKSDVWMAVTDWRYRPAGIVPGSGGKFIASGFSDRFIDARLTVVIEEEFEDEMGGIHRAGLLNLTGTPLSADLAEQIFHSYQAGAILRIPS